MKSNPYFENKENINNNYQTIIFSKKLKTPINFFLETKTRNNELIKKNIINTVSKSEQNKERNNEYFNNYNDEDLDIELISISKKIPINNYINYITTGKINEDTNENNIHKKKPKIRRIPSSNSFFDDIQNDKQNDIADDNTNIFNEKEYPEFNRTNFGLLNRPKISQNNSLFIKDAYNNTNSNDVSVYNDKNNFPIKRHNSVITPNINKFLYINNEVSTTNNNNNNNQFLNEENQRLKKENKRLFLKINELSLKIKTQETKTKINSNNIKQKKLSTQKEEFLLQKIKKLESEIIKQKDLITKLTYNKRFNIGIRKIRVNSFIIKGNNNALKRKNSINNFRMGNLYCNKTYKKNKESNLNNDLNKTLPNKVNKFIKKKTQNIRPKKEELSIYIRPSYSSISSSPKIIHKDKNEKNIKMNTTMIANNRENSINLKLDNIDISKNFKKKLKKEINQKKMNKSKIEEKKINEEYNIINKLKKNNENIVNYKDKKLVPHKTYGKTSLIMSVINDNLLGNFNLSQYMIEHTNMNNKDFQKKLNLKRNSIF